MTQQAYLQFYRDSQAQSYFQAKSDGSLYQLPVDNSDHAIQAFSIIQVATDMMEHRSIINYFYKAPYGSLHPVVITDHSRLEAEAVTTFSLLRQHQMAEDLREAFEQHGYWEHPFFPRTDWKTAVENDHTIQGYWYWAFDKVADHGSEA